MVLISAVAPNKSTNLHVTEIRPHPLFEECFCGIIECDRVGVTHTHSHTHTHTHSFSYLMLYVERGLRPRGEKEDDFFSLSFLIFQSLFMLFALKHTHTRAQTHVSANKEILKMLIPLKKHLFSDVYNRK